MKHSISVLSSLLACSFFSSCTLFDTPTESSQQPTEQPTIDLKEAPSRPVSPYKPAYVKSKYRINQLLTEWLDYFAYYENNPKSSENDNLYERDSDSKTPLMLAAAIGNIRVMKSLIHRGINVNHTTKDYHETALHYAAYNGQTEAYAFLVKNGARQDIKSTAPHTDNHPEEDCDCFHDDFPQRRNFHLRTPKQLLQKRLSDALAGKYDDERDYL